MIRRLRQSRVAILVVLVGIAICALVTQVSAADQITVRVSGTEGAESTIVEILKKMVTIEGLTAGQLTVLTRKRDTVEALRGRTVAGQLLDVPDGRGIAVETIHRFKGLESDVAIVVLPELKDDNDKRLAYIALSRAKSFLVVVGPECVKEQLSW